MSKRLSIRPFLSKKPWKNIFDHYDAGTHEWVKVAGYQIDVWDPISQKRVRLKEHVDYKASKALLERWTELANMGKFEEIVHSTKVGVDSLLALFNRWSKESSQPTFHREIPLSPETIRRTGVAVKGYLKALRASAEADVRLRHITPQAVEKYCQVRLAGGVSRSGINADLRSLKALLNWGVTKSLLRENPFNKVQ